jgi:hypothetical protein
MAEHRFHTPQPVELEVKVPSGDVEVTTIDGEESFILVEGDERMVEQTLVEQRGNRIVVELRGKKPLGITIEIGGWVFGSEKLRVRAQVPHASGATIATASADMHLAGRFSTLETKTASGDLVLHGEIERDAEVKTVSGDVRLERVHGELRAQSVSGDLSVDEVGGAVATKTVSGDARIGTVRGPEATLQSVSGDIELGVASGTNLDVDANSVSGDLASEIPLGSEIGLSEGGPTLVVRGKTVSGDFRLVRG